MPNHVTNKIIFQSDKAQEIFDAVCPGGKFDFELLMPTPLNVYQGGLTSEDEKDFPINWHSWNVLNWGTKWNCYDQSCGIGYSDKELAWIQFNTAWSPPRPIIVAFANRFKIPFEYQYCCEGPEFWGIEKWGHRQHDGEDSMIARISKNENDPADKNPLCIDLLGFDPDQEDEDNG